MADINRTHWSSYLGPLDDGKTLTPTFWQPPEDPLRYTEILTGACLQNFSVIGLEIPAGLENSVEFIHGNHLTFSAVTVHGSVALKGNISGYAFLDCTIAGTLEIGRPYDGWRPGAAQPDQGLIVQPRPRRRRPLRVKLWNSARPAYEGPPDAIEWITVPRALARACFLFRYYTRRPQRQAASPSHDAFAES